MSTVFYHHPHHALVVFDGKLTWPAALELVETLDTVVDTYLGLRSLMFTLRGPLCCRPGRPRCSFLRRCAGSGCCVFLRRRHSVFRTRLLLSAP